MEQRAEMRIAANTAGKTVAIYLPQRIDAGVASFLANLPIDITVPVVDVGSAVLSSANISAALSRSFLWHGGLTSILPSRNQASQANSDL